jgi:hypothetical protein
MVASAPPRRPRIVPDAYVLLGNWRYVEESLLRIIAGWGRSAGDWEDKLAVCYHVWLQAEIVDRLRRRLAMYPGGKPDPRVSAAFQNAVDAAIVAPTFTDAMAGVHAILNPALVATYERYLVTSHPVHDRPTFDVLHEILALKKKQSDWYANYVTRYPKPVDAKYAERVRGAIAAAGNFGRVIEPAEPYARPCGKDTSFAMPATPGRVKDWDVAPPVMPLLHLHWSRSVEVRRLYFMIGYFHEMGVAEDQLRWIYYADFMPFEFVHAEARHMWDESRHGDSGLTRLRDFGLDVVHVGYSSYNKRGDGMLGHMTPRDVYNAFYRVTQIAELGYFETKRYCFDDFAAGRDDASAEMMQFDIIDETSHVEYGRIWLDEMMRRAGVQEDYRARGAVDRKAAQAKSNAQVASYRDWLAKGPPSEVDPGPGGAIYNASAAGSTLPPAALFDPRSWKHYEWLLAELRGQCPLANASNPPVRPNLPM